jgi:hypothetical protein
LAYKKYHQKLKKVVKEANGDIIYTGFIPETDVKKVFGSTDLFIFPYRTKMSASGAFSLCLGYGKSYIVSKAFAQNLDKNEIKGRTFDLNYSSFEKALMSNLLIKRNSVLPIDQQRSWTSVASKYLRESLSDQKIESKLNYAEAI